MTWLRGSVIVAVLAALTLFAFRAAMTPDRLPGLDAPFSYAVQVYTRQALEAGVWPHWNPYLASGIPHFADTLTITMYPPALLLRWIEPAAFLQWMVVLHFVIGGAGTLLAARVIGLGWAAATAAALAVTLGGAVGSWFYLGHLLIVFCVAWFPWILALAIVSVRRGTVLPHPALPLLLVVQFLAGYLQGSLYTAAAVGVYYLYSIVWPDTEGGLRRSHVVTQCGALAILALGISAVQLFPAVQFVAEIARTDGLPYERAAAGGWTFRDLATFFWPFTGVDRDPVYRHMSHRVAYVGWVLACAAPFALIDRDRRRIVVFLLLLVAACTALAFGDNLPFYRFHYMLFPGLRVPGRILFVVTPCVALLGAIGLERLVVVSRERRWRVLALPAAGAALVLCGSAAVALQNARTDAGLPVHLWPWLPLAAVTAVLLVAVLGTRFGRVAVIPAVVVMAIDVTAFATGGAHTVPVPSATAVQSWLGPAAPGRVWSTCESRVGSNDLMIAGRPGIDLRGGVTLRDYEDWLAMLRYAEGPADRLGPHTVRRDLLDVANVSTFVTCEPVDDPGLTLISSPGLFFVYRNERAWPRAVWTCGAEDVSREEVTRQLQQARYQSDRRLALRNAVNVRWTAELSEDQRRSLEKRYALLDGVRREGETWRYRLDDISAANVSALLREAAIEDTHGIDRATGALTADTDVGDRGSRRELLVGHCGVNVDAAVTVADRPDGRVVAEVEASTDGGVVFFSEPFYVERRAFVDGTPVTPRRANLAFTAVPVPAGRHVVELRMVPRTFYAGAVTTGLTLLVWLGAAWHTRGGRASATVE